MCYWLSYSEPGIVLRCPSCVLFTPRNSSWKQIISNQREWEEGERDRPLRGQVTHSSLKTVFLYQIISRNSKHTSLFVVMCFALNSSFSSLKLASVYLASTLQAADLGSEIWDFRWELLYVKLVKETKSHVPSLISWLMFQLTGCFIWSSLRNNSSTSPLSNASFMD